MKTVTYFAIKPLLVGGEEREAGDLLPEASDWAALNLYINEGKVGVVLVATLPKAARDALAEWEQEQEDLRDSAAAVDAAFEDDDDDESDSGEHYAEEENTDTSEEEAPESKKKEVAV